MASAVPPCDGVVVHSPVDKGSTSGRGGGHNRRMPITAERLLSALEPLPFPERLAHTARTASQAAGSGELLPLLDELDSLGPYERRLGALAAFAGQETGFLAERLADPDEVVSGYALRAARLPAGARAVPDAAIEAAYVDASAVLRHRLARVVVSGRRTELAERLVVRLREEWGDDAAARVLPACSATTVDRLLAELAHAVDGWSLLARLHPDPVLDQAERTLAELSGQNRREGWWRTNGVMLAAVASLRPERVLTLLERYGPDALPTALAGALGALVTADAERTVRWIISPDRHPPRHERVLPPGVLRRLVRADPPSLSVLGRHWLHRDGHFVALLKALPPGRRAGFLDEVTRCGTQGEPALDVLPLLPRERRWAEVRRSMARSTGESWSWFDDLDTLAHGPFAEARTELLAALGRSDADDRAYAWPLLVACAGRDGGREAVTDLLTLMRRLRNEQDPVRTAALGALADMPPRSFTTDDTGPLERIVQDALEARDSSADSHAAVRRLAEGVLVEHATNRETALREWALRTLEGIVGRVGVPVFGPLHRVLRRGQEHQVFEALRPWLEAACERADHRLLFGIARAFGPRARRMPALQSMLERALEQADDEGFGAAAELWLDAPCTRDGRVARIVALEPSAVVLPSVLRVLARRRTDLLDAVLGEEPPYGRFLVPGSRRPLPDLSVSGRWLPRQQRAAARLAGQAIADGSLPLDDRAAVIRSAAPVPVLGRALAMQYLDDADVVVAEAALGAMPWTDRPQESLPLLLARAGDDRARVAVYAATRAARFTAPSELAAHLGPLLTGETPAKVTARKEAVRIAARLLPPPGTAALLEHAYYAPDRHPDVRAAVVSALPPLLGAAPEAWRILEDAARDSSSQVREAFLRCTPWELAGTHRARYAELVGDAYDANPAQLDGIAAYGTFHAVAAWARFSPALASRLARTVCDLGSGGHSRHAVGALRDLAESGAAHPVGGAAPGSVLHSAVAELLTVVRAGEEDSEALPDRDLPALQRLRSLVALSGGSTEQRELLAAVADQLAQEPLLAAERAELLHQLVVPTADLPELLGGLRKLADALEGGAATVASRVSGRLWVSLVHQPPPEKPETRHAAAEHLARDGGMAAGMLAVGLVTGMGRRLDWPHEWRALLRRLRRHTHPDVRHEAYTTLTATE